MTMITKPVLVAYTTNSGSTQEVAQAIGETLSRTGCRVEGRRLVWIFDNFFSPVTGEPFQFEVKGLERLIPRQWHHHLLRFNSE